MRTQFCYRHQGQLSHRQMGNAAMKATTIKCLQKVRQILRSQLNGKNGKNKIQAIDTHALPVIRYPADIISCPKDEIKAMTSRHRNSR